MNGIWKDVHRINDTIDMKGHFYPNITFQSNALSLETRIVIDIWTCLEVLLRLRSRRMLLKSSIV